MPERATRIFLIAGEHSGDALGGKLIAALKSLSPRPLELAGIGGEFMQSEGIVSLFPLAELAIMSPLDVLPKLRDILRRINQAAEAAIAFAPDVLVILDSPEFTHQVARRVRRRAPHIPIVDYVSPSVWAWRPWRARSMRRYVDHVLAILPFEPEAHRKLGGPVCSYVGHPLSERLDWLAALDAEPLRQRLGIPPEMPVLVVLPGSRSSEVKRLMAPFGDALAAFRQQAGPFEVILPAVDSVRGMIEERLSAWPVKPHMVRGEEDKFAAFKLARAALAASGTVTLELALSGTPMVVAYRADALATSLRFMLIAHSVVLPNLVLGENVFPELLHGNCRGDRLAAALMEIWQEGAARERQLAGTQAVLERVKGEREPPSERAAKIVLSYAEAKGVAALVPDTPRAALSV